MAMVAAERRKSQKPETKLGLAQPRLSPPIPAVSMVKEYVAAAEELGLDLMPWQIVAGRYITALGPHKDAWLYRRVAVIVARQNGKTEIIKPRVLLGLKLGRKQLHIAQDRLRPRRSTFEPLAEFLNDEEQKERYGIKSIRYANGQEQITCRNGGSYTILAPTSGGARGGSFDDVYVDEAREFEDHTVDAIIRPTTTARPNAQITYFSSAGHEGSVVLNDIRRRKDDDPRMAYLEWSAAPDRAIDDRAGWQEANPALGITISLETLEDDYASMPPEEFEVEHLCRWVVTMRPHLVDTQDWHACQGQVSPPVRPAMAISMDVSGTRASAVIAWQQADGSVAMRILDDVVGQPISTDTLGPRWKQQALKMGVAQIAYDPWTDADLARYFKGAKIVNGRDYANASENFARVVKSGRLQWDDAEKVSDDLMFASRKAHGTGAWMAVKAKDDRPITAVLAAIRAVWLASGEQPAAPRVM